MKINELNGRTVKISAGSITVKNDSTGKTCGVVRGVCRLDNLPPSRGWEHEGKLRAAGVSGAWLYHRVVVDGDRLYFFYDTRLDELYKASGADVLEEDCKRHQEILRRVEASGIEVIRCHIG